MSYLSREPDGCGYYYGFFPGDHRQINVRFEPKYSSFCAYVGDNTVTTTATSIEDAEKKAMAWAKENPDQDQEDDDK